MMNTIAVAAAVPFAVVRKEKPKMAPLQRELSHLEVEPLQIVEPAPSREGFYTPVQESNLDTLTAQGDVEIAALLTGKRAFPANDKNCCCCCGPMCCCC